ncbi:MAG TPA: hypothetical protein VF077_13055 [Nitrospiraceae bacterium]
MSNPQDKALALPAEIEPLPPPDLPAVRPKADVAEQRKEAVGDLLAAAYSRASTLKLTKQELEALAAPFPDEAVRRGAGGDRELLYLPHGHVRARLNQVLGTEWANVQRRIWQQDGCIYADCVLLVRGCYVWESIGAARWVPSNARLNYSDAVESAQSEALRRSAGKSPLGVGGQLWQPDYCDGWKAREIDRLRNPRAAKPAPTQPTPAPAELEPHSITGTVASIEDLVSQSGKPYKRVMLEGDPRSFSTFHKLEGVEVGTEITCTVKSQQKGERTYWMLDGWAFIQPDGDAGHATPEPAKETALAKLDKLVLDAGFTLAELQAWGKETGNIEGDTGPTEAEAARICRAQRGLLAQLTAWRSQEGQI